MWFKASRKKKIKNTVPINLNIENGIAEITEGDLKQRLENAETVLYSIISKFNLNKLIFSDQ